MNLPSRLEEACLFFLLGEKKPGITMATVSTATRLLLCRRIVVNDNNTFTVRTVFLIPVVILSCFLYHTCKKQNLYSKYATKCNKRYQIYRILICSICKWISIINFEVQWMKQWNTVNCLSYSRGTWESHNFEYFLSQISLCCIDVTTTKEWIRLNCKK